jgi:hypothetical protein
MMFGGDAWSNKLLQHAVASLSLADKCALAVSISRQHEHFSRQHQKNVNSETAANTSVKSCDATNGSLDCQYESPAEQQGLDRSFASDDAKLRVGERSAVDSIESVDADGMLSSSAVNFGVFNFNYGTALSLSADLLHNENALNGQNVSGGETPGGIDHMDSARTNTLPQDDENIENVDLQSVLSESDKESLDLVMRMMGEMELNQVENEVRLHI